MTAPSAPGATLLTRLRQRLLARPLTTSLGVALFVLALRRLLSQLRQRLLATGVQRTTTGGLPPPRFVLDAQEDFHAFVFSNDGICVAHGRDPSFVGKSLRQVFANEEIEDSAEMHERFLRAAAAGGGWCAYSWRTSPAVLRLKGAYIFGVDLGGGQHGYAGVGYALCPPASAGRAWARRRRSSPRGRARCTSRRPPAAGCSSCCPCRPASTTARCWGSRAAVPAP